MNVGRSLIWRMLQQYSVYIIKLLVQIILARILSPNEFGLIAIVMVFSSIADIIAVSGLGTALVQKLNPEKEDYSTVFSFSLFLAAIIYFILFISAPLISRVYDNDRLVIVIRVYSLVIILHSYLAILNAYVQKNFLFKKSFLGNFISIIVSGIIAIVLAYSGFGVWALVLYTILADLISIGVMQILIKWHSSFGFDKNRFKPLFSFSWKVLVSSLIGSLLENLYNLTIGKYYGDTTLGHYKQGNTYPDAILGQTRIAFSAVMLPLYSSMQNNLINLQKKIYEMTHIITVLIFPMAFGLAAISETFVIVFLTEKWLPAVIFIRLECIFYGTLPITASLGNGLIAIGRSEVSAMIELSKLIATILCIILLHNYGVIVLCTARVIIAVFFVIVSGIISHRILKISLLKIMYSISKPLLFSFITGLAVFAISLQNLKPVILLFIEICVGIGLYSVLCFLFMKEDIAFIKRLFKRGGQE